MIDRICPTCGGKAAAMIFTNEFGQFAKLWRCERCAAVWGVPHWDWVARDLSNDFGLEPWTENVADRVLSSTQKNCASDFMIAPTIAMGHSALKIALAVVVIGVVLFVAH